MLKLPCSILIATVLSVLSLKAQSAGMEGRLYFLSSTPADKRDAAYPSTLYTSAPGGALQIVREVVPADAGSEFVLVDSNSIVVGYPRLAPDKLQLVHFDAPSAVDSVPLDIDGGVVFAQIVHLPELGSVAVLAHVTSRIPFATGLLGVSLDRTRSPRTWPVLDRGVLGNTWYEGETGGVQRSLPITSPNLTAGGLQFYYGPEKRSIEMRGVKPHSIPLQIPAGQGSVPVVLKCTNDEYAVFSASGSIFVQDLQSGNIQALSGMDPRWHLRIFGPWLASVVVEANPGNSRKNPGSEKQRTRVDRHVSPRLPPVRNFYSDNPYEEWFPGVLKLLNLKTGATIEVRTGQADSEILRVDGNSVLYRINKQIFEAQIQSGKLSEPELIADDENVPEVHWAFWGPQE